MISYSCSTKIVVAPKPTSQLYSKRSYDTQDEKYDNNNSENSSHPCVKSAWRSNSSQDLQIYDGRLGRVHGRSGTLGLTSGRLLYPNEAYPADFLGYVGN